MAPMDVIELHIDDMDLVNYQKLSAFIFEKMEDEPEVLESGDYDWMLKTLHNWREDLDIRYSDFVDNCLR